MKIDDDIRKHAILGWRKVIEAAQAQIDTLESEVSDTAPIKAVRSRHKGGMTEAGRKAISDAQRRRWANVRRAKLSR